jgi:integrase
MHMPTRQKMNADDYVAASRAPSTRREYAKDQRYFLKAGGKLPATADDVVNWLVSVAPVLAPATIQRRLVAIHCWHKEQRLESPVIDPKVKRVQAGINRIRGTAQRAVTPLVRDDLLGVLQALEREATTRAARDMAILLLLFSGALRRSSLVEIRIEHLTVHELGMDIHLPRSKTDQTGKGVAVSIPFAFGEHCPVKAVAYWMLLSAVEVGYLFRSVDRAGRIGSTKLNVASIARIVKKAVAASGRDASEYSSHSGRAGYITSAAMAGRPAHEIAQVSKHKGLSSLQKYLRVVNQRRIASLL